MINSAPSSIDHSHVRVVMNRFYCLMTYTILLLATEGCSLLAPQLDKAAEGAGKLVTFYCTNITDASIREQFRAAVNARAAPNSVAVTCAQGGPPLTVGPAASALVH